MTAYSGRGDAMSDRKKNGFSKDGWIEVKGARTHNLKDIDVSIPRGMFVVISGVSAQHYVENAKRFQKDLTAL